jgi:hypothetical protein
MNALITALLDRLPSKHKTAAASLILIVYAAVYGAAQLGVLPEETAKLVIEMRDSVLMAVGALGALGLRHAMNKTKDAVEKITPPSN